MRDFKKIGSGNQFVDQVQENLQQFFKQFQNNPILTGILHKDININTTFALDHKLRRNPIGYLIIKKDSNANVWNNNITETVLNIESSSNVTVDIWVF